MHLIDPALRRESHHDLLSASFLAVLKGLAYLSGVQAGFPQKLESTKVLESKLIRGARISYKTDFEFNTFFWFFEARKYPKNAPLSIWMSGGPSSSSMLSLLRENGPCLVNYDSNSMRLNPWSWNNEGIPSDSAHVFNETDTVLSICCLLINRSTWVSATATSQM